MPALRTRQESSGRRSHRVNTAATRQTARSTSGEADVTPRLGVLVADLVFVVLTVALFAALTVLIRMVERW